MRAALPREIAANCVYGIDIDPVAVEVARFQVWASADFAGGISDRLKSHLVCADAIGGPENRNSGLDWRRAFPEVFDRAAGFDAIVGNPPYIASKNGFAGESSKRGQSDSYLMFLAAALDKSLVRPGGVFSMVLPDPLLVRGNAAEIRRKMMTEWSLESLLHVRGLFPEANVANVVPICRNVTPHEGAFLVARIDSPQRRAAFVMSPKDTAEELSVPVRGDIVLAQKRCEILYLLEDGAFGGVVRRIHGDTSSLGEFRPPFAPLSELNVNAIFRGEEIGKAAVSAEAGDLPMLMGGQSLKPYEVLWEGCTIGRDNVRKPLDRYRRTKILLQKSSNRIVAALDRTSDSHRGYIFPQSVYAVELCEGPMSELYLLAILNSELMNEYIKRVATGYKLLQPQIEIEDIRSLPVRRVSFTTQPERREQYAAEGIALFELECRQEDTAFPELAGFVDWCLSESPDMSGVVHDLLSYLAGQIVELAAYHREYVDIQAALRLRGTRRAVESIVWQLYSTGA